MYFLNKIFYKLFLIAIFHSYFKILQDIEIRAPAMKRQREEYDHAVETMKTLEGFLEEERELNSSYKQEAEINRQRLATAGRENERLRRQVSGLVLRLCFVSFMILSYQAGNKVFSSFNPQFTTLLCDMNLEWFFLCLDKIICFVSSGERSWPASCGATS